MSLAAPDDWLDDDEDEDEVVARSVSSASSSVLFMLSVSLGRALVAVGAYAAAVGNKIELYSKKECDDDEEDVEAADAGYVPLMIVSLFAF